MRLLLAAEEVGRAPSNLATAAGIALIMLPTQLAFAPKSM